MTSFGKWLGEENGKQMLSEILSDCTKEQARAAVTTYCMIFNTWKHNKWDELMCWIWNHYNSWFDDYNEMDSFMCTDLV